MVAELVQLAAKVEIEVAIERMDQSASDSSLHSKCCTLHQLGKVPLLSVISQGSATALAQRRAFVDAWSESDGFSEQIIQRLS